MTVGLVTVAVGEPYQARLEGWAHAVASLQRPPDQVTIVVDTIHRDLISSLDQILGEWQLIYSKRDWTHHPQVLVNDGIAFTETEWICKMDVDDIILPHALDTIDEHHDTDVLMFGIRTDTRDIAFTGVTAEAILQAQHNLIFSGSPYRKWLWHDNPYRDMIFEDWAFWIGCARQTRRFAHTGTIDYIYTTHPDQISARADEAYWAQIVRSLA